MSDAHHFLEEIKNRFLGRGETEPSANQDDHAWQIVVIDLAGSTLRVLKELEEPQASFFGAT